MYISPSTVPVWFPYMFLCYAAGIRWGLELTLPLAGALSLILVLLTAVKGDIHWMRVVSWLGITTGTFAGGAGLAFLGDRNRHFALQIEFFSRISATMQVDQGLAESLRLFLEELANTFSAEEALLLYRDTDLERIFLWRLKSGESERLVPESMPLSRTDGFLLDDMDATICWNSPVWTRLRVWLGPARWTDYQEPSSATRPGSAGAESRLLCHRGLRARRPGDGPESSS